MANRPDPDQMPHSAPSDLGLHWLLRLARPNILGYYGIWTASKELPDAQIVTDLGLCSSYMPCRPFFTWLSLYLFTSHGLYLFTWHGSYFFTLHGSSSHMHYVPLCDMLWKQPLDPKWKRMKWRRTIHNHFINVICKYFASPCNTITSQCYYFLSVSRTLKEKKKKYI